MREEEPKDVIAAQVSEIEEMPLSWENWLREHGPRLLLFARQQTRSNHDAEDAMQDALVKLARKVEQGVFTGGQEAWRSFLYTQIRREAIDRGRKDDRRRKREEKVAEDQRGLCVVRDDSWFVGDGVMGEDSELLKSALKELPKKFSDVIVMKLWGGRTFDEIGKTLDVSLHTAASRYRYGLEALRKKLAAARIRGDI